MTIIDALKNLILITTIGKIEEPEEGRLREISHLFGLPDGELLELLQEAQATDDETRMQWLYLRNVKAKQQAA